MTDEEFVAQEVEVIKPQTVQCPNCGYNVTVPEGDMFMPCENVGVCNAFQGNTNENCLKCGFSFETHVLVAQAGGQ